MKRKFIGIIAVLMCLLTVTAAARPIAVFDMQIATDAVAYDICADDNFAFVDLGNKTNVYDVSDTDNIKYLTSLGFDPTSMVLSDTRLYVSTIGGCGYINLSDIKAGAAPSLKSLVTASGCSVGLVGNYLFVSSTGNNEVQVRNVGNSRFPKVATLGSEYVGLKIENNKAAVAANGGYDIYDLAAYAGESSLAGFKMGTVPNPGSVSAIDFKDNYVFMANQAYPSVNNRLYAYKINDDGTSTKLWEYNMLGQFGTRISDVVARGNFLYVAGQDVRSIYIFNIKNPEAGADVLTSVANHSGSYYGNKLALAGDKIIATDWAEGIGIYSVTGALSGKALNLDLKLYPLLSNQDITVVNGAYLTAKLLVDNYTTEEISGTVILAVYDSDKLTELKKSDVTVKECEMNQIFTVGSVKTVKEEGCTVKAMFWQENTPVMQNITAQYCENEQYEIYVDAETGSDRGDGTKELPFCSLERAKYEASKLNKTMTNDIYVYLNDGVYKTEDTIMFTAEDSGNNGHNVIYKAAEGANPVISGGEEITGWTLHDSGKNIYKASAKGIYTRQLYVNGKRAVRARSTGGLAGASADDGSVGITCSNTEIASYAHPEELELVFKGQWTLSRIKATKAEIANGKCLITMQQPYWNERVNIEPSTIRVSTPWYYENAYELMDSPGEFYIDKYSDTVYYIPRSGEDMGSIKAYLPKTETLVSLKGSNMFSPVRNITFEGITFANTAWDYPLEVGNCEVQNQKNLSGGEVTPVAVTVQRAENITFKKCTFKNMGGGGLGMTEGFSDCNIIGNEFYDISAWAMDIGEYNANPTDDRLINDGIEINNNYIHDVSVEYMGAAAMSIGHLSNTTIRNNEIYDTPHSAMHIGWGWTSYETSNIKNMVIRNNYIHEIMTELRDGGAIYTNGATGGTNANPNRIYQNYCKNQYEGTSVLYTDEGSCYWRVEQNVVDMEESDGVWKSKYGSTWTRNIHDVHYVRNFVTRNDVLNGGTNCSYTDVQVKYSGQDWSAEAKAIMASAGLEAEYQYLKE